MTYRAGSKAHEFEKNRIAKPLDLEVIKPAQKEWASLIIFAPEMDCTLWFWDYRRLNEVTGRDSYPILRMYKGIDTLGYRTIFLVLDGNSGYKQAETSRGDGGKTSFSSHHGLFQFTCMPFWIEKRTGHTSACNGPQCFYSPLTARAGLPVWHCNIFYKPRVRYETHEIHLAVI